MSKELYELKTYEDINHIDEYGEEFWYARELQLVLAYKEWRKFENVIGKAIEACKNSNANDLERFVGAAKMVSIGSGAERTQKDYKLTRYACYLIAQNGDSRKKNIALAQTYFAIQTRKQELTENRLLWLQAIPHCCSLPLYLWIDKLSYIQG